MSDNTRCFFALTFDTKAQEMLQRSRDTLKRNAAHGSFTHDGNFHLTLEFIGAVSDADLAQLGGITDSVGERTTPFATQSSTGSFRYQRRAADLAGCKAGRQVNGVAG
ncbi:2'-5' RNA ligase family protein [Vibrio ostreae]|uniref:2'-5' RNA ligase family protein n=1 Tax=Vibrio ostreae TaxID=2841925 RepID=UPI002B002F8F|nr:2'-5' RNA ligase family protein [Vibrio ostreae]